VLCGNNVLKQNTVHLSMVYYVYVLLYKAVKHVYVLGLSSFLNEVVYIDFNFYMLLVTFLIKMCFSSTT
jgi:hypothetical protein